MLQLARRRQRPWCPLALAASILLMPGCSEQPQPAGQFVPFLGENGGISYRFEPTEPPVSRASPAGRPHSSADLRDWLMQQAADASERRRLSDLAYQDMRREREEQFRRERREIADYQAARDRIVKEQRSQEQERDRDYRQRAAEWAANRRLQAGLEVARWQQASRAIDDAFARSREEIQRQEELRRPTHENSR